MATRPTVMAPPRSTPVRPAVFLQVYGARPGLSRSLALGAPVFLTETRWSCLRNSKTQEKAWSGRKAPRSYAAVMRAGFDELDADGDGLIDHADLSRACGALGLPSGGDYISELLHQYDVDGDGVVSFYDYASHVQRTERLYRDAWADVTLTRRKIFNPFRRDTTKEKPAVTRMTPENVLAAVRAVGIETAVASDAAAMVALLDRNGTGSVGYGDFRRFVALLPASQLRANVAWDWMSAASASVETGEAKRHQKPNGQSSKRLFAGGLAGIVSRTAVAPLDRARTMIQDEGRRSVTAVCGDVLRAEGPLGLFRGNAVTALKVVPATALQFAIFHNMKDHIRRGKGAEANALDASGKERLTVAERLASGALAGAVSTFACYPLDVLKSQMAVSGGLKGSAMMAARQLLREQGWRAFYKGLGPTLLADIIGTGLGMTLYDTLNVWYRTVNGGRKASPAEKGILGGLSACVCMTATQPLEVIMTRMRVQGVGGRPVVYKNAMTCLKMTAEREGLKSLWLGMGAAYGKVFPQLAVTYFIFELASEYLGVGGLERYDRKSTPPGAASA